MPNSPVQIVLNADDFRSARPAGGGGRHTDFFAGHDDQFAAHKSQIIQQLSGMAQAVERQPQGQVGFAKVLLRRSALAKSHRPITALFRPDRAPFVGGLDLGEMIFEVTPRSLRAIEAEVQQSENITRLEPIGGSARIAANPSRRRSEVGAIEKLELYGPTDKRRFSVMEAIQWLADPRTGSGYEVELFEYPPPRPQWDTLTQSRISLFQSFVDGLQQLGDGLVAQPVGGSAIAVPRLSIRLETSAQPPLVSFIVAPRASRTKIARSAFDTDERHHAALLGFLDTHPLVKRVRLPSVIVRSAAVQRGMPGNIQVPPRQTNQPRPKIGIVDGGVSPTLDSWIVGKWDPLSPVDRDPEHGTFIAGLLVIGQALNGTNTCAEEDGVELVDVAVLPRDVPGTFESYYPNGVDGFLEEIEAAVEAAKTRWGTRVFNLSINVETPVRSEEYSSFARTLDRIAETHDVIFVISAGNLRGAAARPEWPSDQTTALSILATAQNDGLLVPAESFRNVSVGALNPPGLASALESAPANYSRRGPGLRTGVKPDFAHFGGAGTSDAKLGSGLFSLDVSGQSIGGCGTSYAVPLVAKALARLDHLIEGDTSRETLVALTTHHAEIPEILRQPAFQTITRHLAGFGVPRTVDSMLEGGDHEITLVFASRLRANQELSFSFQWPQPLVDANGRCRGYARLTLASSPPIAAEFGAECVRVNLEASLQQEIGPRRWKGRANSSFSQHSGDGHPYEADLIEHGLKWSPTKSYVASMPQGVGKSSTWRLVVSYLTRTGQHGLPLDGVPFTAILTIGDIDGTRPIFNEMRQTLLARGARISDIRIAARIVTRV